MTTSHRLRILHVSPMPPSPPRFGAQARMHGLVSNVARHHDVTAISLVDGDFDEAECRRAMAAYCREVKLLRNTHGHRGGAKRLLQLRSLASSRSYERHLFDVAHLQATIDETLRRERFDVVNLEFPYLAHLRLRQAPPGMAPPVLVLDTHEIAYDLARQFARSGISVARRVYAEVNWRKLQREERAAFADADGICVCSDVDRERLLRDFPAAFVAVVPNAADVEHYQPRPSDPPDDGRTVVFFGLLSTFPNVDGVKFLVREIWPRVIARRPDARLRILGARPAPAVLELAGPTVDVVGFVEDLRPHLASAATVVVPLRVGGGTRLKIVEGMAMAKPIVSTALGAEGIAAVPERDILIADEPAAFATAVLRLLDDAALRARMGAAARTLAVERYAWSAAAASLERFFGEVIARRAAAAGPPSAAGTRPRKARGVN